MLGRSRSIAAYLFLIAIGMDATRMLLNGAESSAGAHQNAEAVLFPECVAKQNAWAFSHPISDPSHFGVVDRKDRDRFEVARKACETFYSEMKRAAY